MDVAQVDLTGDTPTQALRPYHKRKRRAETRSNAPSSKSEASVPTVIDLTSDTENVGEELQDNPNPKKKPKAKTDDVEKRLRR